MATRHLDDSHGYEHDIFTRDTFITFDGLIVLDDSGSETYCTDGPRGPDPIFWQRCPPYVTLSGEPVIRITTKGGSQSAINTHHATRVDEYLSDSVKRETARELHDQTRDKGLPGRPFQKPSLGKRFPATRRPPRQKDLDVEQWRDDPALLAVEIDGVTLLDKTTEEAA